MKTGNKAFCSKHNIAFDTGEGCTWCAPKLTIQPSTVDDSLTIPSSYNTIISSNPPYSPSATSKGSRITIRQKDLDGRNVLTWPLNKFVGEVTIDPSLRELIIAGNIIIQGDLIALGTNLQVIDDIDVSGNLKGFSIKAGAIRVKGNLETCGYIFSSGNIRANKISSGHFIKSDGDIISATSIEVQSSIEARGTIRAGSHIYTGEGISAGLNIIAGGTLSASNRVLAGTCCWKIPSQDERTTTCSKLLSGHVDSLLVETAP